MLDNLNKIFDRAINLDDSVAFRLAVTDHIKDLIIHLNTVIQLGEFGTDSEDDSVGDYKNFTVELRTLAGLQVDHVDFKVTGDYWKSWKVEVVGDAIEISVNKSRFDELVNKLKFSDKHVGLNDENIALIAKFMLPTYRQYAIDRILK